MQSVKNSSTTNHGRRELKSIVKEVEMVIKVKVEVEEVYKDTDLSRHI